MTTNISVNPNVILFDTKTGKLTREGFRLISSINKAVSDSTSEFVRVDATQTLTNKTIDGDANTLRDIGTASLKTLTGNAGRVATGTAGTGGNLAQWDGGGNLIDSGAAIGSYLTSVSAAATYLPTATAAATYLPRAGGTLTGPLVLPSYLVAGVPAAASYTGGIIFVSNESGGAVVAFSDGANWLRVTDRAIIT